MSGNEPIYYYEPTTGKTEYICKWVTGLQNISQGKQEKDTL